MTDPSIYAGATPADATPPAGGLGIAVVERETGINKETLRVWERRYGFPAPWRDAAGERLYPPEQLDKLRLIKRLMDAGHRPGRVVGATAEALAALLPAPQGAPAQADAPDAPEIAACITLLLGHDIDGLRRLLSQAVLRRGLAGAVTEVFAPLTTRVGALWMSGEMQVFQEHIYSESLQLVLRHAIQALPASAAGAGPRVLLTTLPGESHVLGLLMAEALLSLEGAVCLSLGAQTPLAQLAAAAEVHRADVVALSFSAQLQPRAVLDGLAALRSLLAPTVEIWAGGSSRSLRQPGPPAGVRCVGELAEIGQEVTRWRGLLESRL